MEIEPKECPKCAEGATVMPTGLPEIMICVKCSVVYKSTEFGTLEEMTEFDISLLENGAQEVLSKFQALAKGDIKLEMGIKDIGKAGEALGIIMANTLANFRNAVSAKGILNPRALDNILIQALIVQLSIAVAQTVRQGENSEDETIKRVRAIRSTFNMALKMYIETCVSGATTITIDLSDGEEGEKKGDERGTG